jgi:hypothetical protein
MTDQEIKELGKEEMNNQYGYNANKPYYDNGFLLGYKKKQAEQLILSDVGSSGSEFEKDLFKLINNYCKNGLKKPELVKKMEWVLGSCKMS